MKRKNYVFRMEGRPDPKLIGENLDKIIPGFIRRAKSFYETKEGMAEFVQWLRDLPEDGPLAECKAELPMWEAKLAEMEVA